MAWAVTLRLTDCSNGAALSGFISDGTTTFFTDSYGQFIAVIDDYYSGYIVSCSSTNHITKTFHIDRERHAGTVQVICLDSAPPSTGTFDGW